MTVNTQTSWDGLDYYRKFKDEIEQAAAQRDGTLNDFNIFVRENGYMIILPEAYEKLRKKDKKLIDKSYEYKRFVSIDAGTEK